MVNLKPRPSRPKAAFEAAGPCNKAERIRELSKGIGVDYSPLSTIDLRMFAFRVENRPKLDRDLAVSLLRREAFESKPFLRRVKSRLSGPDCRICLAALSNHVTANGSAEVADILLDLLIATARQSSVRVKLPGNILATAMRHSKAYLPWSPAFSPYRYALGPVLTRAVLNQSQDTVRALLERGADPNQLCISVISRVASTDLQIFELLLRSPTPLNPTTIRMLYTQAINQPNLDGLSLLLRLRPCPYSHDSYRFETFIMTGYDRDTLLEEAIRTENYKFIFLIADFTRDLPLSKTNLFASVLDAAHMDPSLRKDVMEVLLLIGRNVVGPFLCRCVEDRRHDIVRLIISYGVTALAEAISLACQNLDMECLEILVKGTIHGSHTPSFTINLPAQLREQMQEEVLLRLLKIGARGDWTNEELIKAVSSNRIQLLEPLFKAKASADYQHGECLKIAILSEDVRLVETLLAGMRDFAGVESGQFATLASVFPTISRVSPLPRRALTKIFLNAGVEGICVDTALNKALCDYSADRDLELIDILLDGNSSCDATSLSVAMYHKDTAIFDKLLSVDGRRKASARLRKYTPLLDGSVFLWFERHHEKLFGQLRSVDANSALSSACLKLVLQNIRQAEHLCGAHGGPRKYECFHRFMEGGAHDDEVFKHCLKFTGEMDCTTLTEFVLTATCFCNTDKIRSTLEAIPFSISSRTKAIPFGRFSRTRARVSRTGQAPKPLPSLNMPRIGSDISKFCDARSAEAFKILFGGDIWFVKASDLAAKLLKRHLEECAQSVTSGEHWPTLTIEFLLSKMADISTSEYISCLSIAASSKQWTVFRRLLDRQLPKETLGGFILIDVLSLVPEAIEIFLDSFAISCMPGTFFLEVLQNAFDNACNKQGRQAAILLCSKFRRRLRLTGVLDVLKSVMDMDDVQYVYTLLENTIPVAGDLEVLWQHVDPRPGKNDILRKVQMLIQAGATGPKVIATLTDAISHGDKDLLFSIISTPHAHRSCLIHEYFDYENLISTSPSQQERINASEENFLPVPAKALSIAIQLDKADTCRLLCEAGAPLVYQGQSLVEAAVVSKSDTALLTLIESPMSRIDHPFVVNFALLQAVLNDRLELVEDLICRGGSTQAYNHESLKVAARLDESNMLEALLAFGATRDGLYAAFEVIMERFTQPNVNPTLPCEMLRLVHKAGLEDHKCFSQALLSLCRVRSATWGHASILTEYGASVEYENGQCMMEAWRFGNLEIFGQLFSQGVDQSISTRLLVEACDDYTRDGKNPSFLPPDGALVVLAPLLQTEIPQYVRNTTLDRIAKTYGDDADNTQILQLMLEKGACFSEDSGEALYRSCNLGQDKVSSLVSRSNPPSRARMLALQHLFRGQGTAGETTGPASQASERARRRCLNNIISPESNFDNLTFQDSDIVDLIESMLSLKDHSGVRLMWYFFFVRQGRRLLSRFCPESCRNKLEQVLSSAIQASRGMKQDHSVKYVLRVMQNHGLLSSAPTANCTGFALNTESLNRLLLLSLQRGRFALVSTLLAAGADASAVDDTGRSALCWAALGDHIQAVNDLIVKKARVDDGSLHIAACQQNHEVMQSLLDAGHDPNHLSSLHDGATPLIAFVRFQHSQTASEKFEKTLAILLKDVDACATIWSIPPNPLRLAFKSRSPYHMLHALFRHVPPADIRNPLIRRRRFRYSLLSVVEEWGGIDLTPDQQRQLAVQLEGLKFRRIFYAVEGDHPHGAVGIPDHLLGDEETRNRRKAYNSKECSVCGGIADRESGIHARLAPDCAANHGWNDYIICTDCLRQYLESKMFPGGDDKFPSANITCWAPDCQVVLTHPVIRHYADPERFSTYDEALCQQYLQDGQTTAKCATVECLGAIWFDAANPTFTVFKCATCHDITCILCNQLYKKHDNQPCPAGEEAKANERRKREDEASEAAISREKKCPKCHLAYQRRSGCDHITCGKDTHTAGRSCKFSPIRP